MTGGYGCWGACVAGEKVTAAGGTRPTGMHSCLQMCLYPRHIYV